MSKGLPTDAVKVEKEAHLQFVGRERRAYLRKT